jgi:hypothetical protein
MPKKPKPLEPLIPIADLKSVMAGLIAVPKDAVGKPKSEPKKPS